MRIMIKEKTSNGMIEKPIEVSNWSIIKIFVYFIIAWFAFWFTVGFMNGI